MGFYWILQDFMGFYGLYPLLMKHGWLENHLSMEVLMGKSLIDCPFSISMFDYRRRVFVGRDVYKLR